MVTDNVVITTTDYAGAYIYENSSLKFASHAEGYIEPDGGGGYSYVYQYKDHLGNVRLSYTDSNNDGVVDVNEIVEESNYYPFGLKHRGYNSQTQGTYHPYGFGGKEEQSELELEWLDFSARNYDAGNYMWGSWMRLNGYSLGEVEFGSKRNENLHFRSDSDADQRAIKNGFIHFKF